MKATTPLQVNIELQPALKFPLRVDIITGITLPALSDTQKELVEILQTNGGFYYTNTFPTNQQLQRAVNIRRGQSMNGEAEWSWLYVRDILYPERSYHSFVPDMSVFSVVESSDWPYLPIMVLDFNKVMRKYNSTRLVNFLLQYQIHLRKTFTEDIIRSCSVTQDGRILGIEYGDVICNMEPLYINVDLMEGQYTYLAGIVNGKITVGYKQCLYAEEIGSKHVCIYRKFISMDPNAKIILGGEVEYKNKQYTYNMQSGTFSARVATQTLDTILNSTWPTDREAFNSQDEDILPIAGSENAEQLWWIPLVKFLLLEGKYTNQEIITPAARLTTASATKLCAITTEEKNMHEFANMDTCVAWSKFETSDIDMGKLTYAQSFCHPSMDMRKFIGLKIIKLLAKERNIELKEATKIVISSDLTIDSEVINVSTSAIILRATYKGIDAIVKIATTYAEKQVLQKEMSILNELKDVPNIVLPLYYATTDGLDFIVFPYYNRGNLATFDLSMNFNTMTPKTIFPIAIQVASFILPALEGMHAKGYIHLDVSLGNIVVHNVGADLKFALTDMGMAQPITLFEGNVPITVIRSASRDSVYEPVALAKLMPPTYSSDYESLGYVLYDLVYANLPWRRIPPTEAIKLKEDFNAGFFTTYFQIVKRGGTATELLAALKAEESGHI